MKDTEVEPVVALTGIAVEVGEGWKCATLASPESRLPAPKILPTPSAGENNEQRGDSKHNTHYV